MFLSVNDFVFLMIINGIDIKKETGKSIL
jgi:hypothetical protein